MVGESSKLLDLAREKFAARKFSAVEKQLFLSLETGKKVSGRLGDAKRDDPAEAHTWNADRTLSAEYLTWLCTDQVASAMITHRGIEIEGVKVEGVVDLSAADVKFPLWMWGCSFNDPILLRDARLLVFGLQGCHIKDLSADRITVRGPVFLRNGFKAEGEVRFLRATIAGDLDCIGAQFSNAGGVALSADGARIQGVVSLLDVKADGKISLIGARIAGNLQCDGAHFINPGEKALDANAIKIEGYALFRNGFRAEGELSLLGATIGGCLECDGAQLLNPNGKAVDAEATAIRDDIFLRGKFKADGQVNLVGSTIGGSLQIWNILQPERTVFDFRWAKVGTLVDEEASWPKRGNLFLDGFRYERIYEASPLDARTRTRWLDCQEGGKFVPQPYEQLAKVLREMGHERDAKTVMIEKNRRRGTFTKFPRQSWWWYNLFGRAVGYGYAPWRAFAASVALILLGTFLFGLGFSHNLIAPTKAGAYENPPHGEFVPASNRRKVAEHYPVFNAFIYSLESFTPLLKLDQKENWAPNANYYARWQVGRWEMPMSGNTLRWYLWGHVIAGWVLTTLWVGAVTGLVKS